MHRKDSQDSPSAASFRSRQDPAAASPGGMNPAQLDFFRAEMQRNMEVALRAALAAENRVHDPASRKSGAGAGTPAGRVVVVTRPAPQGLAASYLTKNGYYPSFEDEANIGKLYVKTQPDLAGDPGLGAMVGQAIRNARAHLSRLVKEVLPTIFPHSACPVGGAATVRFMLLLLSCLLCCV